MVRSSGTSAAAAPSPSSRPPRVVQRSNSAQHHRSTSSASSSSSGKGVPAAPHVSPESPERRPPIAQTEHSTNSPRTIRGERSIGLFNTAFGGSTESTSGRARSNSADNKPSIATPATPTVIPANSSPISRFRPALRLHPHSTDAVSQVTSVSTSSPQRRAPLNPFISSGTNSSITTPSTGTSEGSHFWKSSPQRLQANNARSAATPSIALSYEITKTNTEGLSLAPELVPEPPPKPPIFSTVRNYSREDSGGIASRVRDSKFRTREHRSPSQKMMLSSALQKANTAVTLDNAENYEGAMEAYGDACVLLGQVMMRAGGDDDRKKLQAIQETYTQRIEELRTLTPRNAIEEKQLPARPLTEEYTDQESLFTIDDDESTIIISTATATSVIGSNRYAKGGTRTTPVPPRRDSLYLGSESLMPIPTEPVPPLPITRSRSAENMVIAPLSPARPPPLSPKRADFMENDGDGMTRTFLEHNNRESFTFGAAALSPRFSTVKERDYGIRRSVSDASSISSKRSSQRQSNMSNMSNMSNISNTTHSRQGSEVSTSWLNTIDESGGSVSGESSPGWTRKKPRRQSERELRLERERLMREFEDDFDTQLDAAVEAAYDDGYEVDYTYDRDEEILMMKSPRMNVERAKQRVREVEQEMELEIQKEKERRLERERLGFVGRRRDSELDFFDDRDDGDSEDERMLEEMTRGYTLDDFEFNLDSKTALPRESASTAYSDSTLPGRESGSSGYSSGTTWASSIGSAHMLNAISTPLSTVDEAPPTPPPLPPPSSLPPQGPPPPPPTESLPLAPAPLTIPLKKEITEPVPALPIPNIASIPSLAVSKPSSVRTRRLSALSEPLKIETSAPANVSSSYSGIPTTLVRGPSPQPGVDSEPPSEPPPLPPITPPLNIPPKSANAAIPARPGTSSEFRDGPMPEPPATAGSTGVYGRKLSSPTPPNPEPSGGLIFAAPLTKTASDDGSSGSPSRFAPRIPGIPGALRQIQSSASLKSRNLVSPEAESPSTSGNGLFSSSSTSNLRKAFPRSATPATPSIVPMTPMGPPPTAGLPAGGMHLFESKLYSPATPNSAEHLVTSTPAPLEPCPGEALSKPYWLMRCLYQTVAHPRGGYISSRVFVPREVWFIKGVKIKAIDDKISACDLVSAALSKLATVKQDDVNAIYEEMQSLEGVLDRVQTVLSKKLGNDVGGPGARTLYGIDGSIPENGTNSDMITKSTGVSGGKSYFSLRKLRTKTSNTTLGLGSGYGSSSNLAGEYNFAASGLPKAVVTSDVSQQPMRNLDSVTFGGPHAAYISALARVFDSAQILDRLNVFDEDSSKKMSTTVKIGIELSHRHAAEFFGFFICRFVLVDVALLLDKFVKRGSEWVSG